MTPAPPHHKTDHDPSPFLSSVIKQNNTKREEKTEVTKLRVLGPTSFGQGPASNKVPVGSATEQHLSRQHGALKSLSMGQQVFTSPEHNLISPQVTIQSLPCYCVNVNKYLHQNENTICPSVSSAWNFPISSTLLSVSHHHVFTSLERHIYQLPSFFQLSAHILLMIMVTINHTF